jgi:hypothetical protein
MLDDDSIEEWPSLTTITAKKNVKPSTEGMLP